MTTCFTAGPGVNVIATTADIPTLGSLAVNSFVVHGLEPLLVDTGTVAGGADFMAVLRSVIDPQALRWIWLTHSDFDHIGSLVNLLELNPKIRCGSSPPSSVSASWACPLPPYRWTGSTSSTQGRPSR